MVVNGYHIKLGKVINFAFSTLSSHSVSTEALEVPITKISQLHIVDLLHLSQLSAFSASHETHFTT